MVKVNGKTGGGSGKGGKGRQDKYYHLAKETGFRARSAFKLIQLDRKHNFLKDAKVCIDLCAAPGGWMQVAVKHMPKGALVVGVDLVPIKPVVGAIGIVADITTEKCRQLLKKELKHFKANVVLNDGAPNVGKDWRQDAFTQSSLVLMSLKLACEWLLPGGTFVSKVFRSRDYNSLMYILGKLFKKVKSTKPQSSRNVSAEIFVVCEGYLAPAKIDPKMLDPKYVFGELDDAPTQKLNVFAPEKKKRAREGYAEGNVGAHTTSTVGTFIASEAFLDVLALNNALLFADEDKAVADHEDTDEDIRVLLSDLKVLGKKDFRTLIKWRTKMKDYVRSLLPKDEDDDDDEEMEDSGSEADVEEDEQTKLEKLVVESKVAELREKKRLRRKKDKSRLKDQERQALSMDHPMDFDDIITDKQLFALKEIKSLEGLTAVDDATWEAEEDEAGVAVSAADRLEQEGEDIQYTDNMEDQLAKEYDEYLERRGMKKKKVVFKSKKSKIIGAAIDPNEDAPDTDYIPDVSDLREQEESDAEEDEEESTNPLIALNSGTNADKNMNLWFAQKQFADMEEEDDSDSDEEADEKPKEIKKKAVVAKKEDKDMIILETDSDSSSEESDSETEKDGDDNFEVVKAAARAHKVDNSNNLDAHGLALAAEMIIRKRKREIIDNAYNRYAFNDGENPNWFVDEEAQHRVVGVPITREMADDIKARQRELNDRPIKKVLEAKNRKKKKIGKQLDNLKNKATTIYESDVLSEREKNQQIEALYKKAKVGEKHKAPQVVVARKKQGNGRPSGVTGRYIMVDSRSKTELRAKKFQAVRAKRKKKFR
eukprot:m.36053 g.36053  ORF g.36053 m.36053 type:complete len:823 (-) comp17249_c0_seq1:131-2599(-)